MQDSYEKIKIALPENLLELIDRDAESFDFFKKDKTVNRNGFVNALVVAYFDTFRQKEAEERAHLLALAKKSSLNEKESSLFIDSIIAEGYKGYVKKANYSASLSFRPTKESIYIISHIESNLLRGSTFSDYFRRMLFAYGSLPQFRREAIVFKDVYKKASKAIEAKNKFTSILRITPGKENLFRPMASRSWPKRLITICYTKKATTAEASACRKSRTSSNWIARPFSMRSTKTSSAD